VTALDSQEQRSPYRRDEDDEPQMQEYQERHRSLSDRVERFVMQVVILGLVALVLIQTLQVIPSIRRHMSLIDALEGVTAGEMLSWTQGTEAQRTAQQGQGQLLAGQVAGEAVSAYSLTVVLVSQRSAPAARLLLDGQPAGSFSSGSVTVKVKPGQQVAVDGTGSPHPLTFRVAGAFGLSSPAPGVSITIHGDRRSLGTVQVKK
jgi:hypothetical protein